MCNSLIHIVNFFVSYQTCTLGHHLEIEDASKKAHVNQRLRAVMNQTATVIPPRVLLPVLTQCFQELVASNQVKYLQL